MKHSLSSIFTKGNENGITALSVQGNPAKSINSINLINHFQMKKLIMLVVAAVFSTTMFAQNAAPAPKPATTPMDNGQGKDKGLHKGEIKHDKQELKKDKAEWKQDKTEMKEDKAKGDIAGAKKEKAEVKKDKENLKRDKKDLEKDKEHKEHKEHHPKK